MISKKENIGKVIKDNNSEIIIRKCHSIEKKLQIKQQNAKTVKSYYKKAKLMADRENNFQDIENTYKAKMMKNEKKATKILMESVKEHEYEEIGDIDFWSS